MRKTLAALMAFLLLGMAPINLPPWIEKLVAPWLPKTSTGVKTWGVFTSSTAETMMARVGATNVSIWIDYSDDPNDFAGSFSIFCFETPPTIAGGDAIPQCNPLIRLTVITGWPDEIPQLVLLHELGHWSQFVDGSIWSTPFPLVEWEADRWAVAKWCTEFGGDPNWFMYQWDRVRATGYTGDYRHGTPEERIAYIEANTQRECDWTGQYQRYPTIGP